jgi:hypothetical protein
MRDYRRKEELSEDQLKYVRELAEDRRRAWFDTAPSEMPPVQPDFTAPSSDPA